MHSFYLIFCLFTIPIAAIEWDLAVASRGMLEFVDSNGNVTGNLTEPFTRLRAMVYDSEGERIYLTDSEHEDTSIFVVDVNTQQAESFLMRTNKSVIAGIAYDPSEKALYWTTGRGRTINRMSVTGEAKEPTILLTFDHPDDIPNGIAVDHCEGYLYWTNLKYGAASVGRSRLDGSGRESIATIGVHQPMGIAVDQRSKRLFWADDQEGQYFTIESSDLAGNDRTVLLRDSHHQPQSLAVGIHSVYWSDTSNRRVWQVPKFGGAHTTLRSYQENPPLGIVSRISAECFESPVTEPIPDHSEYSQDSATTLPPLSHCDGKDTYCVNGGTFVEDTGKCRCASGYSGLQCEVSSCYNYCIHGACYIDAGGNTNCQCQLGYKGQHCHVDVCEGYCLNGGICNVNPNGDPMCTCEQQFLGQRCQIDVAPTNLTATGSRRYECAYMEVYRIGLFALVALLAGMTVAIALLVRKVYKLSKRPRIRKQIIVKKNVTPLTSRPQNEEQCEITIENCCNMNICETPCFEPQLRTSKSKSKAEEKKNLLDCVQDLPQDDLY